MYPQKNTGVDIVVANGVDVSKKQKIQGGCICVSQHQRQRLFPPFKSLADLDKMRRVKTGNGYRAVKRFFHAAWFRRFYVVFWIPRAPLESACV